MEVIAPNQLEDKLMLGSGAFGCVYQAKWRSRPVAVKYFNSKTIGDDPCFEREIEALTHLQSLKHPNIIRMFARGTEGPQTFIVMEVALFSLDKIIHDLKKEYDYNFNHFMSWTLQLALALECCHHNSIIHRDINPTNLLLFDDGRHLKICDFVTAKLLDDAAFTDTFIGTPYYLAPEVVEGKHSFECDVYSFAVTLWEMITRHKPTLDLNQEGQPHPYNVFRTIGKGARMPTIIGIPKFLWELVTKYNRIENWLKEGEVELKVTRINMHGAPGAGKTCSQRLLLNEPPPPWDKLTDSTSVACPAVQATRISIDDKNRKWEKVDIEDLLHQLASTEVDEVPRSEDDISDSSDELSEEKPATNEPPKKPTKNKRSESESSETEPTENEPTKNEPTKKKLVQKISTENISTENKLTNTEVGERILHAFKTGKSKKLNANWVYFIDSGGQPAYRELLPLFTKAAALNIITIDLTKGLDEKSNFQYRISQNMFPIKTKLHYSNRSIIRSTISSEAMVNPIKFPYVSDMPKHHHYLILGTRKELVTEEKLKEMNESLINSSNLSLKSVIWNTPQESIIFPVNTMLPAGSKEREDASMEICTELSNCRVEMTIKLPIRLFTFEISLQLEAERKKRSFLTKTEVIKIGKSLRLDEESDIITALQYLHNVTIILYYGDVLENLIFINPKPILDVLSRLIAITYVSQAKIQSIADPPPSPGEKNSLVKLGLFKEELLAIIGKQIFNNDFQPSHMITLLKHLHIIAEVENKEEGHYFFPCSLPSCDKIEEPSTKIQPLLIAWQIGNSGTKTLAIPQGLFPLTIVHLLEQRDYVDFTPVGKSYYRYYDAMSLHVYIEKKKYTIDIVNCYTHIKICFYDCKKACPQIRKLVIEAIKRSSKNLDVDDNHIFAFKCAADEQCYCIVKEDYSSTICTHCRSPCEVLESDDDSCRCWFSDQISSPGVEASDAPSKRHGGQPTELDTSHLIDILDLLWDHGYSGVDYYFLGLRLGLLPRTLDVIKENNKDDVRGCLTKCLTAWLEQRDNVKNRTYDALIQALRKMGEKAVADGIERNRN
ncbi:PREDICTED: uncharacterized protein LOC109586134 isoform X2 [Amphimedon queenslandica]|uniref:Mitogen-activated protein kinase kinase kinase n=1 Tax=Amphimedon queenslandica TaxID=400682 RepID=A0AAN0JLK6_AMPQE|nr:PREDICTED: uncharacterized protein LOC109586134 isoform X2 [Amphimedon queenslandica]|eukprot:XP_019857868.1 PREDICTED: uncharacterized protein LOC109586134 isoform X2 [Amphimedon queenslandica]